MGNVFYVLTEGLLLYYNVGFVASIQIYSPLTPPLTTAVLQMSWSQMAGKHS